MGLAPAVHNSLVKHIFGLANYTAPSAYYISLHSGDPGATGTDNEVVGNGYTRIQNTNWQVNASDVGMVENINIIQFPTPTNDWGTVTHVGLYDAATTGNLIARGVLNASKSINTGDSVLFPAEDYTLRISAGDGV